MTSPYLRRMWLTERLPLPSKLRKLRPDDSLEAMSGAVDESTVIAFDFDQTLKLVTSKAREGEDTRLEREGITLRGGEASKRFLESCAQRGIPMCIITAAEATKESVSAIAAEVRALDLGKVFNVDVFDTALLESYVAEHWADNDALDSDTLRLKLLLLLAAFTDRLPSDLSRIGRSQVRFAADGSLAYYKLQKDGDWGARLRLDAREPLGGPCDPVACLRAFLERDGRGAPERGPDRLFVRRVEPTEAEGDAAVDAAAPGGGGGGGGGACPPPPPPGPPPPPPKEKKSRIKFVAKREELPPEVVAEWEGDGGQAKDEEVPLEDFDDEAVQPLEGDWEDFSADEVEAEIRSLCCDRMGYDGDHVDAKLMRDIAEEIEVDGCVFARCGNVLAARYNKIEALSYFIRTNAADPDAVETVMWVDDNADNVFTVYDEFARHQVTDIAARPSAVCYWYPPLQGREEDHNSVVKTVLNDFVRHTGRGPPPAPLLHHSQWIGGIAVATVASVVWGFFGKRST